MSANQFRTFWIKTVSEDNSFTISVGKGRETLPFMSHTWKKKLQKRINFVAFSSWTGHSGDWKILPHNLKLKTKDLSYKYYYADIIGPLAGKLKCSSAKVFKFVAVNVD